MSGDDVHQNERQAILTRLLDAVKQCQVRFGGRSELATDSDSRVSCLCSAWEAALQHGMKKNSKALSALKQMTERAGLAKVTDLFSDIKRIESDPVFWHYAKEHLTKHEYQRFNKLKLVNTDSGRGRAWLRASLNEHSLERYMHMLIESDEMLSQHYEDWAFLRDVERSSMLPNMAAGLGSILFAITVDRPELNKAITAQNAIQVQSNFDATDATEQEEEPSPVISESVAVSAVKKKDKKKKRKVANVVSFDDDDTIVEVAAKSGSTSTNASNNSSAVELQINGEMRENGEGVQDSVFLPESSDISKSSKTDDIRVARALEIVAKELPASEKPSPLLRGASQMSTPSIRSVNSDRLSKSSTGSFSDLDHDNGTFMAPVNSDGMIVDSEMVPFGGNVTPQLSSHTSFDAGEYPRQGEMESASLALALAQQSLSDTSSRTDGDGGSSHSHDSKRVSHASMTQEELKQAVVAMMLRKDSVEEQNKKLEGMLQHEMETSSTLRAEIEELRVQFSSRHEKEQAKIQALQKENELLKHQLKKYVNAVQMLRTEGINKEDTLGIHLEEPQPSLPPPKPMIDYSHEAAEYEKKLIQVAEMHGELMEFNEQLHRQSAMKDAHIRQLKQELVTLRGPLPYDRRASSQDLGGDSEEVTLQRTLINIWIPSAFLRGTANNAHHVYQVYVRIRDEEWNVYRRYNQFLDTHQRLKKVYPIIGKFEFPPKKAIGKKDAKLVESRRQVFQAYLRNVINVMLEKNEQLANSTCKEKLISYLPFFNDKLEEGTKKGKKGIRSPSTVSSSVPMAVPEGGATAPRLEIQTDQYQGF